ncbi:BatD [hydrothermal vent metagenome]|uniref:BatD n=1 Tax=hydrothermal vent metagenome TaxID=652676 RepID=A0A1W1EF90_9ZZZZ
MRSRYLLILFFLLTLNVNAVEGKIKVYIKSNEAVYTSQKVTVAVELLSDAFSIGDARISFPLSSKYIVKAPKSASYLGQSEVNGTDWQMVHYEYEVYALSAGEIEIPTFEISFSASMGYGQPKKEFDLQSESVHFSVKSPKGMKPDQFVLVTDNYTLSFELKPEKKRLIIGDAVEFSVIQKANAVPDILLRPIHYNSNAQIRVYNKEPELNSELKGKYDVSRIDRFTFLASTEGNVTLPAQEFVWWNTETKEVQKEKIPEITFEVLPDPQIALDIESAKKKRLVIIFTLITSLFLILWYFISPFLKSVYIKLKKEKKLSKNLYSLIKELNP